MTDQERCKTLELRRDEKGRFKLFCDGGRVSGVVSIDMSQDMGQPSEFTVRIAGRAVRVVEHVPTPEPEWCDHDGSSTCPVSQYRKVECQSAEYRLTAYAGGIDWKNVKRYRVLE